MSFKNIVRNAITTIRPGRIQSEAARHARRAYRKRFSFSNTVFAITIVFLFLPLFSLIIATTSAATATVLGTIGAIGVNWYKFKLRGYVQTISFLPMILPEIIIGVSLSIFFAGLQIPLGLFTIYVAHTTFNLPFVFLMVMARLDEFDFSIIEAAHDLGATERETLFKVTLPICMPGIISGLLTAITLSLEDFVITFFVAGPGSSTLPVFIYSAITRKGGITPLISALSVVMIMGTVILSVMLRKFLKFIAAK